MDVPSEVSACSVLRASHGHLARLPAMVAPEEESRRSPTDGTRQRSRSDSRPTRFGPWDSERDQDPSQAHRPTATSGNDDPDSAHGGRSSVVARTPVGSSPSPRSSSCGALGPAEFCRSTPPDLGPTKAVAAKPAPPSISSCCHSRHHCRSRSSKLAAWNPGRTSDRAKPGEAHTALPCLLNGIP